MEKVFNDGITAKKVLKFTMPTIAMMIFMSLYTMVDGVFVSNYVGANAFSSLNIVFPAMSVVIAIGVMLGMGGSAIVAKNIGEKNITIARQRFSMLVVLSMIIGIIIIPLGLLFREKIVVLLGATEVLFDNSLKYLSVITIFSPFLIIQLLFQSFFVTAGKPNIGLTTIIIGGITNIVLDYVFIVLFKMGVLGAAFATCIGIMIPSISGLIYFSRERDSSLYFVKPRWELKIILQSAFNGSSEMVTNLANAVTTFLFNLTMLKYYFEDGVAAITIALYLQYLLTSVFMGYSMGILPVISYSYGGKEEESLKKIFKISLGFIAINSVIWYLLSIAFKTDLIGIFVSENSDVFSIASGGWKYFAISFLFCGFNIFASALFTAFSDGKTSAIISMMRTFIFLSLSIIFLPKLIGGKGVWLSVTIAELITLVISTLYVLANRIKYKYM